MENALQPKNSIAIDESGNIIIQDAANGNVTININDAPKTLHQLKNLNETQISALSEVAEKQKEQLSDLFSTLLSGITREKNIVKGNISNVQSVRIGDETHYHYYYAETELPKELTINIPKTDPAEIVGREEDLAQLHKLLTIDKKMIVVKSLGGLGKTTLAQAYVSRYYDEYHHIAWITQSPGSVESDFINAGGLLQNLGVETINLKQEEMFSEILRKLKTINKKPGLLVIDNAGQTLGDYRHVLPGQPQWHLLITSREEIEGFHLKLLDFLSEEKSIELFRKYYPRNDISEKDISELVQAVDYHTLTIEILAKTGHVQRYDVATLKEAVEKDLRANIKVDRQAGSIEKVGTYLSTVFSLSRLDKTEIWLMKHFAVLPAEFHTYKLLYELIVDEKSPYKNSFAETIQGLAKKGWLLYNIESDSYKMHRIVASVVKKEQLLIIKDIESFLEAVTQKLLTDETKDNPVDKFSWVSYGKALLAGFTENTSAAIAKLQNNLAIVLQDLGDYAGAKALLEKAMLADEKNFGKKHPATSTRYSNLALVLQNLGDYEGAKSLLEKAVISDEKSLGKHHFLTALRYSNLALVLRELGDYARAKSLLEKAVLSNEKNFGKYDPSTVKSYSNLGLVLKDMGDYEAAKMLLEEAMLSTEKNFGKDHPTTAASYFDLATVLQDLGEYERAKSLLESEILIREKNFGQDHPATAKSYSNLALVLDDLGDHEGAKTLLEKAMLSNEKYFGKDHPETVKSYSNLATVLEHLGNYESAKLLLEKAVASSEKKFGPDHSTTAIIYSNLGSVLQNLGNYRGARSLLEKAMLSAEKNFGNDHPATAISYSNLATVLQNLGEYHQALTLSEMALTIFKKTLPEGHPNIEIVTRIYESIRREIK